MRGMTERLTVNKKLNQSMKPTGRVLRHVPKGLPQGVTVHKQIKKHPIQESLFVI